MWSTHQINIWLKFNISDEDGHNQRHRTRDTASYKPSGTAAIVITPWSGSLPFQLFNTMTDPSTVEQYWKKNGFVTSKICFQGCKNLTPSTCQGFFLTCVGNQTDNIFDINPDARKPMEVQQTCSPNTSIWSKTRICLFLNSESSNRRSTKPWLNSIGH